MKGGETLGNEEGSEETSEEGSEEEVSPTRIYTPGVRPLTSGVFLCLQAKWCDGQLAGLSQGRAKICGTRLDCERRRWAKQSERRRAGFWGGNRMFPGDQRPFVALEEDLLNELRMHGMA